MGIDPIHGTESMLRAFWYSLMRMVNLFCCCANTLTPYNARMENRRYIFSWFPSISTVFRLNIQINMFSNALILGTIEAGFLSGE